MQTPTGRYHICMQGVYTDQAAPGNASVKETHVSGSTLQRDRSKFGYANNILANSGIRGTVRVCTDTMDDNLGTAHRHFTCYIDVGGDSVGLTLPVSPAKRSLERYSSPCEWAIR